MAHPPYGKDKLKSMQDPTFSVPCPPLWPYLLSPYLGSHTPATLTAMHFFKKPSKHPLQTSHLRYSFFEILFPWVSGEPALIIRSLFRDHLHSAGFPLILFQGALFAPASLYYLPTPILFFSTTLIWHSINFTHWNFFWASWRQGFCLFAHWHIPTA